MKNNKILILILIVFLIATVCVACNRNKNTTPQQEEIKPSVDIIYDNEIAEERFLKERISDATAIYYKSSVNGEFGDNRYLFEKTILPSAYTELDYIQSTGSQSIDTGIKYADTLHFDLKFSDYTSAVNTGGIFGTEGWMFSLTRYQPTKLIWCTEQKKYFSYNSFSPYKTYTVQCGKEFMTINDVETISVNSSGIFGTQNITLFKSNTGYACVKIYYFKIYDGEEILRNYIPCYRNYDKAVGLYDLVSKRFYCNSTESNFEQGTIPSSDVELPKEYQQVEYIESTGTQRIKLDVVPKSTYKIESTFAITDLSSNNTIWCARGETQEINTTTAFYIANQGIRCDYGTLKESFTTDDIEVNSKHTLIMDSYSWYLDGSLITKMDFESYDAGSQIQLFASHYNGIDFDVQNWSKMKLYSFRVYDANRILVLDVIPCYRKSDSIAGLYDLINKVFYTNAGTGAFNVGNEIKESTFPSAYQPIEYISTTGTQFIITDIYGEAIWEYDIQYDLAHVSERQLMGHGGTAGEYWGVMDGKYGKSSWSTSTVEIGNRDIFRVENYAGGGDVFINGVLAYNNSYDTRCGGAPAQIFAIKGAYCNYCTLYGCKVYDVAGKLIRNFVPCYRKIDNVAGLYDLVNNKFYMNSGAGIFGMGEAVSTYDKENIDLSDEYSQVEYIESTGTQYIDLGTSLDCDYFELDCQYTDTSLESCIIGNIDNGSTDRWEIFCDSNNPNYSLWTEYDSQGTTASAISSTTRAKISFNYTTNQMLIDGGNVISKIINCQPRYLFQYGGNSYIAKAKIYRAIFKKNGVLILDLIPCVRKPDAVSGLFDLVNNVFYTNPGTDVFEVGDVVNPKEDAILPSIYQQLDYIKSTGTQYIDTNFTPNQNTGIEIKFSSNSYENNNLFVYGSGVSHDEEAFELYPWDNNLQFNYGVSNLFASISFNENSIITAYQKKTQIGYSIDGESTYSEMQSTNSFISPYTLFLFALHREDILVSTSEVKLYSCKIWDNGTLVREFIPCVRKQDSVVGLYDVVNNLFYINVGTGDFVSGNPVETSQEVLPMEYEKVDYLESFGTGGFGSNGQEIDLGITMDMDNDWAEVTFQSTLEDQNGMILATKQQQNSFWFYHYVDGSAISLYIRQADNLGQIAAVDINLGKHTFAYRNKQAIMDGSLIGTETRELGVTDNNLYLFSWGGDYYYSGKIYGCKIWKSGELVRNLVPCYRKSDSEPGMYDLVNGVFYTNTGTGTFVAGNNSESLIPGSIISPIKYLEEYDSLKYLTSAGQQYIDTDIVPSNDVSFEIAFGTDNLYLPNAYVMGNGLDGLEISLEAGEWKVVYGSETATFETIPTTKTTIIFARKMMFVSYNDSYPSLVHVFASSISSTRSLALFATNREDGMLLSSGINVYGFRMMTGNSMCEYVPSIRKEDGAYGMYDGVQNKLLASNGTSEFISSQEILSQLLPNGYHILEYVEGYGKQYINTGIKDSSNTMFEIDALTTSPTSLIGTTTGMNISQNLKYPGGYFYYINRSSGAKGQSTINKRTLFKMNNNLCYKDDVLVHTFNSVTKTDTQTMFLFGRNSGGVLNDAGDTKIYSCKIYESKMLVRYYIPACRDEDGEIGLYDLVTSTFYTNEGEEEFGSNETENAYKGIVLPSGYRQVEYIEGTGTQYFDTEIIVNKSDILEFETKMQYTSTTRMWSGVNCYLQHTYDYFKTKELLNIKINYDGAIENIFVGDFIVKTNDFSEIASEYANEHVMILAMGDKNGTIFNTKPQPAKVYSVRLVMNDELVLDCVPCYRESDNEAGLYDLVRQRFIKNAGKGNVLRGPEINNIPYEFEQVDYIEYTGSQQIVLPHSVTSDTIIELTFDNNTNGTNNYPIIDMGDTTLCVVNNVPTYNVFDASITALALITNDRYGISTSFDKDNALVINDAVYDTESITAGVFTNSIKIFGNATSLNGTIKIFRVKVFEGNKLVYDLIPCVRKYDGKIGFYEHIDNKFYETENGEMECNVSFAEAKTKNLYEFLDYVYFDDEHYLDLSYTGTVKYILDASFDTISSNGIMGYLNLKEYNWGVGNGKYIFGTSETYTPGSRDIIIDEYTANAVIRYLNGEQVANIPLTKTSRGVYRLGSKINSIGECCIFKAYEIRILKDDVLVAELIPAKRKSDQSIGFLDKLTDQFYVVYDNKNNFVMGNIVGHYFDTNNVVEEVSESHNGDIAHICSICGTEIHEIEESYAYKVNFSYGTGVKEIKVFKGYDLSSYEVTNVGYTRNKYTNNFSRNSGQVFFEIILDEGYEVEKVYPGDAVCTNYEDNIYILSDIANETTIKVLARKKRV